MEVCQELLNVTQMADTAPKLKSK